ncbi:MAG: hypothetical protein OEN01_09035 [Candidatus Krumholzibacteria bacterium]|nr:hypothetical protein [Candidatus Krumholzibacteria bacterium]
MAMWEYFDTRARRLGILDTKLAQAASIFLALVVVKLVPQILEVNVLWFVLLAILCAIKPVLTFYVGKG